MLRSAKASKDKQWRYYAIYFSIWRGSAATFTLLSGTAARDIVYEGKHN